jgi:hypothetical protein
MRRVLLAGLGALAMIGPATVGAQVGQPQIGCFSIEEASFRIIGVPGAWITQRAHDCVRAENPWRIVNESGQSWLVRLDAESGAVWHRQPLGEGTFAAWADGTVLKLDELGLPSPVLAAELISDSWLLVRLDGGALAMIQRGGTWSYLPPPVLVPSEGE